MVRDIGSRKCSFKISFPPPVRASPLLLVLHARPNQGFTVSDKLEAAPGEVVSETEHASTYRGATAISFEGINRLWGHHVNQ